MKAAVGHNDPGARFGYVAGLDGLRFLAVMIVILAHYHIVPYMPGGFGVAIFFSISGFLITRLMLAEEKAAGHVALGRFYGRRFIRLLPPLAAILSASAYELTTKRLASFRRKYGGHPL